MPSCCPGIESRAVLQRPVVCGLTRSAGFGAGGLGGGRRNWMRRGCCRLKRAADFTLVQHTLASIAATTQAESEGRNRGPHRMAPPFPWSLAVLLIALACCARAADVEACERRGGSRGPGWRAPHSALLPASGRCCDIACLAVAPRRPPVPPRSAAPVPAARCCRPVGHRRGWHGGRVRLLAAA